MVTVPDRTGVSTAVVLVEASRCGGGAAGGGPLALVVCTETAGGFRDCDAFASVEATPPPPPPAAAPGRLVLPPPS